MCTLLIIAALTGRIRAFQIWPFWYPGIPGLSVLSVITQFPIRNRVKMGVAKRLRPAQAGKNKKRVGSFADACLRKCKSGRNFKPVKKSPHAEILQKYNKLKTNHRCKQLQSTHTQMGGRPLAALQKGGAAAPPFWPICVCVDCSCLHVETF